MRRFDAALQSSPLFGPHLLEASAGTGKTFSIEHVFVRLILESVELEQILTVTFTRAATRELKARIRKNLDQAIAFLEKPSDTGWDYLKPFVGSREALSRLRDARSLFDQCQIFTIHSFCYRMLQEFAFEAHLGFLLPDPDEEIPKKMKRAVQKFLEEVKELCPEQMAILLREYDSVQELGSAILKGNQRGQRSVLFSEVQERIAEEIQNWKAVDPEELWETFQTLEKGYKVAVKGNFEAQVKALAQLISNPKDPKPLQTILWEKANLFSFLSPENRKVRMAISENPFFERARNILGPIIFDAVDPKALLETLITLWQKSQESWWSPDEILRKMRQAIERKTFAEKIQNKYCALIVDEFQDTDPLQWEIFQHLFLKKPMRALYLVGDPKQSIYRFRNADVYTYLKARDLLGDEALYSLDVNFRSSKKLLDVLNALFDRNLFHLPKVDRYIPYRPVEAGKTVESFDDGKGAVHAVFADEGFEKTFLPYAVKEIERLFPKIKNFGAFAILVKDRYQAEAALKFLSKRKIAAFAKSHELLGETESFRSLRELFEAIIFSEDPVRWRIVETGPFANVSLDREVLQNGLAAFFQNLKNFHDQQIIEELLQWEQREGFSFEGLLQCLEDMAQKERHLEPEEDAVQILTLHISKGLEFDVVFAFGLATPQPEVDEEIDAEKLRQLYVAMTRAKRRLYIPLMQKENRSPMGLFCRGLDRSYFEELSKKESFTFEEITTPVELGPPIKREEKTLPPREQKIVPYQPCYLYSFTALAREKEKELLAKQESETFTIHSLPRGAETGIAIHQIFERIFSAPEPVWRNEKIIENFVEEELAFSPLEPWKEAICQMLQEVIAMPLFENFSLKDLEPKMVQTEMEFLFEAPPHFAKGFIDLVFCFEERYYLLDWKTNWLGGSEEDYHPAALKKAMCQHDYELQASLYAEALQRHLKRFSKTFGGVFYLFVRGKGFHFFQPDLELFHGRIR